MPKKKRRIPKKGAARAAYLAGLRRGRALAALRQTAAYQAAASAAGYPKRGKRAQAAYLAGVRRGKGFPVREVEPPEPEPIEAEEAAAAGAVVLFDAAEHGGDEFPFASPLTDPMIRPPHWAAELVIRDRDGHTVNSIEIAAEIPLENDSLGTALRREARPTIEESELGEGESPSGSFRRIAIVP